MGKSTDLKNNIAVAVGFNPQALSGTTDITGEIIDTFDYDSVTFVLTCDDVAATTLDAQLLIQEGDVGDKFYILSRGTLVVTTQDDLGLYVELTRLRPGATFGELSLLKDQPRGASITTLEECVLFSLGREEFGYFLYFEGTAL